MKKIKILFYSHTIDFAGTWRSHERILLNLDKSKFEPYVFYNPNQDNNRLDYLKSKMDNDKIISFYASKDRLGPEYGYAFRENNFAELAKSMNFDIIHFARGGYYEWPFTERIAPIQIETNIFGYKDNSPFLDYSVGICETISNLRNKCDDILYNPIPLSMDNFQNLKDELNIPENYTVFGRMGRAGNFHPTTFNALKSLKESGYSNFKYIIFGACDAVKRIINDFNLVENCILMDTTNDDDLIHKFHNTIDIFLHYRSDGECHSTAISQAMMYGKPIISHFAGYNGQYETISNGGFVCNNDIEYFNYIKLLIENKEIYNQISKNSLNRSRDFEQDKIVESWQNIYIKLKK